MTCTSNISEQLAILYSGSWVSLHYNIFQHFFFLLAFLNTVICKLIYSKALVCLWPVDYRIYYKDMYKNIYYIAIFLRVLHHMKIKFTTVIYLVHWFLQTPFDCVSFRLFCLLARTETHILCNQSIFTYLQTL